MSKSISQVDSFNSPQSTTTIIPNEEYERLKAQIQSYLKEKQFYVDHINERERDFSALEEDKNKIVAEMNSKVTKLQSDVTLLRFELDAEKSTNNELSAQLRSCQEELKTERQLPAVSGPLNETNLFNAESKIEQLQSEIQELEVKCNEMGEENFELIENMRKLENKIEEMNSEIECLRNENSGLQTDLKNSQEEATVLNGELHALKSNSNMASQGNSLFGEVIDGREKQEREMLLLFKEKEKLRLDLDKALKMLHDNAKKGHASHSKDLFTGPTLAAFKHAKDELARCQRERDQLQQQVQKLQETENKEPQKAHADSSGTWKYQELKNQENLQAKQRLERRVRELELQQRDLLDAVKFEKQRAASIPQLEGKINRLNRLIEEYETQLIKKE
ncbi:hypothetical protein DdX_08754 [Ditylenchus destructor]|uniref:Uncharacterized protein n=1 Tax=Ditylenchus destructor TaxID=166010 RepID=A0AAD4R6N0_9BILA|nr:hypothetical protein DdX_08754 [Ditylenchus destructor]